LDFVAYCFGGWRRELFKSDSILNINNFSQLGIFFITLKYTQNTIIIYFGVFSRIYKKIAIKKSNDYAYLIH